MEGIFLNATQHPLNESQVQALTSPASGYAAMGDSDERGYHIPDIEIINLKEDCEFIFNKVANIPYADVDQLESIALDFHDYLAKLQMKTGKDVHVHLPIGSPAFMWTLALVGLPKHCYPVFSHSDRIAVENNGKKVVEFQFKGFIEARKSFEIPE